MTSLINILINIFAIAAVLSLPLENLLPLVNLSL